MYGYLKTCSIVSSRIPTAAMPDVENVIQCKQIAKWNSKNLAKDEDFHDVCECYIRGMLHAKPLRFCPLEEFILEEKSTKVGDRWASPNKRFWQSGE